MQKNAVCYIIINGVNFMSFVVYIVNAFKNFDFLVDTIKILVLVGVLMFIYCYSANHNNKFFATVCILTTVVAFGLTFLATESDKTFWKILIIFVFGLQVVAHLVFFRIELRRDLFKAGAKGHGAFFVGESKHDVLSQEEIDADISQIVKACQNMSKTDTGALIVVVKDDIYDYILESGTQINAKITSELLETIFYPKSPLHDGAVIIKGDRILAAGCYLPLSQDTTLPREFGTRHRAAYGLTEAHPSLTAIVVSEESGIITAMYDKHYKRYIDSAALTQALKIGYGLTQDSEKKVFWGD